MNRIKIKEHVIGAMKNMVNGIECSITGDYPQSSDVVAVVVAIINESPVVTGASGRIAYNFVTGIEKSMLVSILAIGISVYAPIDEESVSVCEVIKSALTSKKNMLLNSGLGINRVGEVSGISNPIMRESGERKTWLTQISINLTVTEIVESDPAW